VQTNRLVVSKNDTVQITFRVRAKKEAICSRVTNVDGEKVVAEVPEVMPELAHLIDGSLTFRTESGDVGETLGGAVGKRHPYRPDRPDQKYCHLLSSHCRLRPIGRRRSIGGDAELGQLVYGQLRLGCESADIAKTRRCPIRQCLYEAGGPGQKQRHLPPGYRLRGAVGARLGRDAPMGDTVDIAFVNVRYVDVAETCVGRRRRTGERVHRLG